MVSTTTVTGYSFYLNVVVINKPAPRASPSVKKRDPNASIHGSLIRLAGSFGGGGFGGGGASGGEESEKKTPPETISEQKAESDATDEKVEPDSTNENEESPDVVNDKDVQPDTNGKPPQPNGKPPQPDAKKAMEGAGKAMEGASSAMSAMWKSSTQRAAKYVASKTMVSRAGSCLDASVAAVTEEMGLDMSITRRFNQGPVYVLEVDIKGCDMSVLLENTWGEEAASHYKSVRSGMEALGTEDSKRQFEAEILPKVRRGLMEKLSTVIPEKMKSVKGNEDLGLECIALEDQEEARWLYNFLEFMQQMK